MKTKICKCGGTFVGLKTDKMCIQCAWRDLPCGVSGYNVTAGEFGDMLKTLANEGRLHILKGYLEKLDNQTIERISNAMGNG